MQVEKVVDDHLFNADFSNLSENYLRGKVTIEDATKLWEGETISIEF